MMKLSIVLVGLLLATPAGAEEISGPVRVRDGDTVVVGRVPVRLKGVDAAERGSALGEASRARMIAIIGASQLTCELTGERTWDRQVGYCKTDNGTDIGQAIIEQGFALACARYSRRYVEFEQASAQAVQERAPYCTKGQGRHGRR